MELLKYCWLLVLLLRQFLPRHVTNRFKIVLLLLDNCLSFMILVPRPPYRLAMSSCVCIRYGCTVVGFGWGLSGILKPLTWV
jgi:hypothetical protein